MIAIVAQGVCTMLMTMTPFPQLVMYVGFTLSFFAAMGVASLFYFRRQPGWRKLGPGEFRTVAAGAHPIPDSRGVDRHLGRTIKALYFVSNRDHDGYGRAGIPLSYPSKSAG